MKNLLIPFYLLAGTAALSQMSSAEGLIADNGNASKFNRNNKSSSFETRTATESELIQALTTATPEMKVSISEELVERKSAKLLSVFSELLADDGIVQRKMGVIAYETNAASELYVAVAHQKEKAERKKYYEKTTSKGLQAELKGMFGRDYDTKWTIAETNACLAQLTAAALADDEVSPGTLNTIFYTNNFKNKNYARVKFFAQKYPTAEILATLANFRNSADISYLTRHAQASYLAYSVYPHAAFFPTLQMNVDSDFQNKDFQNAVTAYKDNDSRMLLEKMCANICKRNAIKMNRDEQLFQLYSIIEKRNCRLYDAVLKKIDVLLQ